MVKNLPAMQGTRVQSLGQENPLEKEMATHSMDYSLPGFSVHGVFQARILEWVAIPFSRGSS